MKSFFYQWDSRLRMNDYLILRGGVQAVVAPKFFELAKKENIKVSHFHISPIGIRVLADSDPSALVEAVEEHLREFKVCFRVEFPLLSQATPEPEPA